MCQKIYNTKQFFLLLNHSVHTLQPSVVGVLKDTNRVREIAYKTKNDVFLLKRDVEALGYTHSVGMRPYIIPFEIPRDWFLH
jgi:hypothetical protein